MTVTNHVADAAPEGDRGYAAAVGLRLRSVRRNTRLSLREVQHQSDGRFKAVVVGSYERGDRTVSVKRLSELADFYGVPISTLFPAQHPPVSTRRSSADSRVVIDLQQLRVSELPGASAIQSFVRCIQGERGDYASDVLSLRADDLRPLAIMHAVSVDDLLASWRETGLLRPPPERVDLRLAAARAGIATR